MTNATKVVHQQDRILWLMKTYANDKGYVKGLDIENIASRTGITRHDVTKTLWGMRRRNLIGFSEMKGTGQHSIPFRFRLKKLAFADVIPEPEEDADEGVAVIPSEEEMVTVEVPFTTNDPEVHAALNGKTVTIKPNAAAKMILREVDLRFAATLLSDYGLDELGVKVLEHLRLSDEELHDLKQYYEL